MALNDFVIHQLIHQLMQQWGQKQNNPRRSGTPGLAFQAGWSHPKKLWCCQREQRGCEGSPGGSTKGAGCPRSPIFFPGAAPKKDDVSPNLQ